MSFPCKRIMRINIGFSDHIKQYVHSAIVSGSLPFYSLQIFDELAQGETTFSINIDRSCETCYNVRLLKVKF